MCSTWFISRERRFQLLDIPVTGLYPKSWVALLRRSERCVLISCIQRSRCVSHHVLDFQDSAISFFVINGPHLMSTSPQRADMDPTRGTGRSMACRPVGIRTPKRVDTRWMMRRSSGRNRIPTVRSRTSLTNTSRTEGQEIRDSG
jgi:hypothetical protein